MQKNNTKRPDSVPDDSDLVPIVVPKSTPKEAIDTLVMTEDYLFDYGINAGDCLIIDNNVSLETVHRQSLCVVYLKASDELMVRKLRIEGDTIILRQPMQFSVGDLGTYSKDEVDLRGVVMSFQRHLSQQHLWDDGEWPELFN